MNRRSTTEPNPIAAKAIADLIGKHPQIRNSVLVYGRKSDLPDYVTTANNFGMECHVSTACSTLLGKLTSRKHIILVLLLVKEIPRDVAIVLAEACEWINPFYILQIYKRGNTISHGDEQYEVFIHSAAPVSGSSAAERVSIATKNLFHPANAPLSIEPPTSLH